MKKAFIAFFLILAMAVPAFSQLRFELGVNSPVAAGYITGDGTLYKHYLDMVSSAEFFPIPNISLILQTHLGSVLNIGAGVKAHSLFIASLGYPSLFVELSLGAASLNAGIGGLYFGYYTVGNLHGFVRQNILLPEVSFWLGLGKRHSFRLGGGVISILSSSFDFSEIPFAAFAGLKVVLE